MVAIALVRVILTSLSGKTIVMWCDLQREKGIKHREGIMQCHSIFKRVWFEFTDLFGTLIDCWV
jgi:hypothetical protein